MSGDGEKKEKVGREVKGGPSRLREMLVLKYPSLSIKDASKLILKAREHHGGSLSGMKMGQILKSIKILKIGNEHQSKDSKFENEKKHNKLKDGISSPIKENRNKNTANDTKDKETSIEADEDNTLNKTCKFCFKIFLHRKTCRQHMKQAHGYSQGSYTMNSEKVSKQKVQKSLVKNIDKNKCSICDKVYLHSFTLNRHIKTHEIAPAPFKCKFCDKTFTRKDILTKHEQVIHRSYQIDFPAAAGQKNTDSLRCQMCSLDFGDNQEGLFAHLSAKVCQRKTKEFKLDDEHRFECKYCSKKYLDRDGLGKHIRLKHSKKRVLFDCNVCTSKFQQKSSLVRHLKNIHGM